MFSLKSPKITHFKLDVETRFNNRDSKFINASSGTLGDLYNSAIQIWVLSANSSIVLTASMPLDAYLCVSWLHVLRKANHNSTFIVNQCSITSDCYLIILYYR